MPDLRPARSHPDDVAVAAFDFQLIGTGSGSYDLAYFVTQSLEVDVAAKTAVATIELDGSVPGDELAELVDHSWELVVAKLPRHEREALGG